MRRKIFSCKVSISGCNWLQQREKSLPSCAPASYYSSVVIFSLREIGREFREKRCSPVELYDRDLTMMCYLFRRCRSTFLYSDYLGMFSLVAHEYYVYASNVDSSFVHIHGASQSWLTLTKTVNRFTLQMSNQPVIRDGSLEVDIGFG